MRNYKCLSLLLIFIACECWAQRVVCDETCKVELEGKLKEMHVDAVISGNCGCGLCTPKEVGSCITAEYLGIPAVAIAAPSFVNEVYYTSINNGVPAPRVAEY